METRRILPFVLIVVFALMLTASVAYGPGVPTATYGVVWTTDINEKAKITFDITETIYIHWVADGSVNIKVESETATHGPWFMSDTSGFMEFHPSELGYHRISCTGAQVFEIAVGRFFVIPDLPFGTLMAAIACFGAFGAMKLKRKHT